MTRGPFDTAARFSACLAALLLVSFWRILLGGETLCYRDFGVLAYPVASYHHDLFWQGRWPLWNPYSNCGAPFLAQWGTMTLYPGSLIYLLLPLPWSLNFFCIAHLFLAGLGAYLLARRWGKFPAALAGISYAFSGLMLACLVWPNYVAALAWAPWLLSAADALRTGGPSVRRIVRCAAVAALQLLTGVPEIVVLTWTVLLILMLLLGLREKQNVWRILWPLGAAAFLAASLAAAQLLPFFNLLAHSHRDLAFGTGKWSLPLTGLGNLLLPMFHAFRTFQNTFFQPGQEFFSSTYLGAPAAALGLYAILARRPGAIPLGLLALLSVLLALGESGGLYSLARLIFPFLGLARYPVKFLLLLPLLLALLAALAAGGGNPAPIRARNIALAGAILGAAIVALLIQARVHPSPYDWWSGTLRNSAWRAAAAGSALLLFFFSNRSSYLQICLVGLIALDGMAHLPNITPSIPNETMAGRIWEKAQNIEGIDWRQYRVMISPWAEEQLLRSKVPDLSRDLLGKRLALWSHLNLLEQIPKINGSSTLQLREQRVIQSVLYANTNSDFPDLRKFLGVRMETRPGQPLDWDSKTGPLPLVTGGQMPIFTNQEAILGSLTNGHFNSSENVYLESPLRDAVHASSLAKVSLKIEEISPEKIRVVAEAATNSLLVISQSYDENWRARVDGQKKPLLKANYAFQAVEIPGGRSVVELSYSDQWFGIGLVWSAATMLGSIVACRPWSKTMTSDSAGSQSPNGGHIVGPA